MSVLQQYREVLQAAEEHLDVGLPDLHEAAVRSDGKITDAQKAVDEFLTTEPSGASTSQLDILAFGSMARHEMVPDSDFDYLVVAHATIRNPRHIQVFREAANAAMVKLLIPPPGSSGLFGGVFGTPEIVNRIGLEEDSNSSLSRRMLILEECLALNEHNNFPELVHAILSRYLLDYEDEDPKPRVPRFLLNDVVRYWRTITVDYQAKRWDEIHGDKWGSRYLKMRSSRKWTFAGTVASLLLPVATGRNTDIEYLIGQFRLPALGRLAQLSKYMRNDGELADALRTVLSVANEFVGWNAQTEWRNAVSGVEDPVSGEAPEEFRIARARTIELQAALEALFLSDEVLNGGQESLGAFGRRYLLF